MNRRYPLLYALIVFGFLLLAFASSEKSITGAVTADFENRVFDTGDILTGKLEIDIDDNNLPVGSVIQIKNGEEVFERPLLLILDDEQKGKVEDIIFYPAVKADLRFVATEEIDAGTSITDYISGRITGFDTAFDVVSSGGSGGGGSSDDVSYSLNDFAVSSGEKSVSFDGVRVIDVQVVAVKLSDGTPIDKSLVDVKVLDKDSVEIVSKYNEKLKGFKKATTPVIRVPFSVFRVSLRSSDLDVSIISPRGDVIKSTRLIVPYKGSSDSKVSLGESYEDLLNDFSGSADDKCGDSKCRIESCVSPNVDSGKIMLGEISSDLITRVVCSNSCVTVVREAICPKEEDKFRVVRDVEEKEIERVRVVNQETDEVVATIDSGKEKLDIVFSQFS